MNIMRSIEEWLGFDFPVPVNETQRNRDKRNLVRSIVANLSSGNISLQNGHYIMEDDVEQLRKNNQAHDFCA